MCHTKEEKDETDEKNTNLRFKILKDSYIKDTNVDNGDLCHYDVVVGGVVSPATELCQPFMVSCLMIEVVVGDNDDEKDGQPSSSLGAGTPALHCIGLHLDNPHKFSLYVSDLPRFLLTWGLLSLIGGGGNMGGRGGLLIKIQHCNDMRIESASANTC